MLLILWCIAGFIIGWVLLEVVSVIITGQLPILFNLCMGFVGALTAYTLLTGYC